MKHLEDTPWWICDEGDYVFQKGEKVHVITYLSRFLFNKHLISQPINRLSGGQRSRLLMAKMILSEADLLFLDEPTNDLDLMTLELLERNLSDFQGTLVLVSHDRFFVDQICNIILDIEGDEENRLFADIFQWLDYRKGLEKQKKKEKEPAIKVKKEKKRKGLTYNDQRELNLIEETMESEEEKLEALQQKAASESMNLSPDQLNELYSKLQAQQDKVDQMYERWQELESLKAGE